MTSIPSPISVLKGISSAYKREGYTDKVEIYLEGGVRRGIEVLKAISYGAQAVFIDTPVLYALHHGGQESV